MAKKKPEDKPITKVLPDILKLPKFLIKTEPWYDETELPPWWKPDLSDDQLHAWRWLQSRKRCLSARRDYLASVLERPTGITTFEFLAAHSFTPQQRELAKAKGLNC